MDSHRPPQVRPKPSRYGDDMEEPEQAPDLFDAPPLRPGRKPKLTYQRQDERPVLYPTPKDEVPLPPPDIAAEVEYERRVTNELGARQVVGEQFIVDQARDLGYDPEEWKKLLAVSPQMATDMVAARAERMAELRRQNPAQYLDGGKGEDYAVRDEGALQYRARTVDEARQLSARLMPPNMLHTHTLLWDQPAEDGVVYSYSFIRNEDVRKKLDQRRFSILPNGPVGPGPSIACDMHGHLGVRCTKKLRTLMDLEIHRQSRHPAAWQASQRAAQQRKEEEERAERRADAAAMRELLSRLAGAGTMLKEES